MKRKLSFLLALVFVLTLAFNVLPETALAASVGDTYGSYQLIKEQNNPGVGTYDYNVVSYGTANIIAFKQGAAYVVWADSTLAAVSDDDIITIVQKLGSSYKNMDFYTVTRTTTFNMYNLLHTKYPAAPNSDVNSSAHDVNIQILTGTHQFTLDKGISHYSLIRTIPQSGSMTVKKLLDSNSDTTYAPNQEFTFKVTFTKDGQTITGDIKYASANGIAAEPQTDGSYLIKLKIGEQGTFTDIPTGTWYDVVEQPLPEFWQPAVYLSEGGNGSGDTTSDGKGKIVNAGTSEEVKVTNKYVGPQVGSLTVKKVIRDSQSSPYNTDQDFTITVKFTSGSLTGAAINSGIKYNGNPVTSANGEYTITLKIGQQGTFTDIPVNAWYLVTEPSAGLPLYWENASFKDEDAGSGNNDHDGSGKINEKNDTDTVDVKNKYVPQVGTLKVWKSVVTPNAPSGVQFPVTVTFTLPDGIYNSISTSGYSGTVTPSVSGNTYTYSFNLTEFNAPNSHIFFNNVPVGTTYTVTEGATQPGWSFIGFDRHNYIVGFDLPFEILDKIDNNLDTDCVGIKNAYSEPVFGALDVTKTVTGNNASTTQAFAVKVTFTNTATELNDIKLNNATIVLDSSGSYTVNLTSGQTAHFTNIPEDTAYSVEELALDSTLTAAGWSITSGTASGTIIDSSLKTATVTNKYDPRGTLAVTKDVITVDAPTESFAVKVEFTVAEGSDPADIKYNGNSSTEIVDLTATFVLSLTDAASAIFTNIPMDTTYTVSEPTATMPAYWTTDSITNGEGRIVTVQQITVTVNNAYVPKGELTVGKLLNESDIAAYSNKTFAITVTFEGSNLTDIGVSNTTLVTGSNGSYTATLKHGETVKFTNIPIGTKYTVSENSLEANWVNMTGTVSDTLTLEDFIDDAIITNSYNEPETGTLSVTKVVTGSQASTSQEFTITVQFTMAETNGSYFSNINATNATGSNGSYTMSLHHGESAYFTRIPLGATYTVTELSVPTYWTRVSPQDQTGVISTGQTTESQSTGNFVTVTNRYDAPPPPPPSFGSLTVDKAVTGIDASATEKFAFTVTFTGSYGTITNNAGLTGDNGVYTFSLSANDTPVTFSNILVGVTYTVSETITPDQITAKWAQDSQSGTTGTITTTAATALITNTIGGVAGESDDGGDVAGETEKLPQTGGISSSTLIGLFGLALIAIGGTSITIFRKKNDSRSK